MSFKIADGYVEVHAKHDRASTRRNAQEAVKESDKVGRENEGSLLRWLFKTNPKLMRMLEAPLGSIFGSPLLFAAMATFALAASGFLATAITTGLLTGLAAGFIGIGAMVNKKELIGPWNKMVERIEGVFKRASKPIVGPLIRAFDMIGDAFEKWEPTLNRIYKALAPLIEPMTGGLLGFLEAMLPGIERALPGIQVVVLALAEHLPGLGEAMGDFFATIAENEELLKTVVGLMITWLENFFKVAGPVLVFFMYAFAGMAIEWKFLMDALKGGAAWVEKTWKAIPGWWDESWGKVKDWFKELGEDISGFFTETGNRISTWWDEQTGQIAGWWDSTWGSVSRWFEELPGRITGFLTSLPERLYNIFLMAFDRVFYLIGFAAVAIPMMIAGFIGQMVQNFREGWSAATGLVSRAWEWMIWFIMQSVTTIIRNIGRFFMSLDDRFIQGRDSLIRIVYNLYTSITTWFDQLPTRLYNAAHTAWNNIYDAFSNGRKRAGDIVRQARDNFVMTLMGLGARFFSMGLGARFFSIGQDAIRGLVNGIGSYLDWAVDMAWRAALRIRDGFLDALDIGSPSKVMADEVGKWIPAGIAVGIESNMGDLEKQAAMFPDLLTGVRPAFGGGSSTPSEVITNDSGVNIEQVIFQVQLDKIQDLDDIKNFLEGKLGGTKANTWAGNIYEKTGEYERSYR